MNSSLSRQPLVSVIIPCYGHAKLLPRAIESVLSQTYEAIEIVVVDDGSPDDSYDVACTYANRAVRAFRQPNAGPAAARNRGIEASRGDWCLFLDADDSIDPNTIQLLVGAATPDAATVFGSVRRISKTGEIQYCKVASPLGENYVHAILEHGFTAMHAILVRRSVIDDVGMFDLSMRGSEDWEFWLRIAAAAKSMVPCPDAWVNYYEIAGSESSDSVNVMIAYLRVLRKSRRLHGKCEACDVIQRKISWMYRHNLWRTFADADGSVESKNKRLWKGIREVIRRRQFSTGLVPIQYWTNKWFGVLAGR